MSQSESNGSLYVKFFCPSDVTTVNMEEYLSELCENCNDKRFQVVEVLGSPTVSRDFVVAFQNSETVTHVLELKNPVICGKKIVIQPHICGCVTADINERWIEKIKWEVNDVTKFLQRYCPSSGVQVMKVSPNCYKLVGYSLNAVSDVLKCLEIYNSELVKKQLDKDVEDGRFDSVADSHHSSVDQHPDSQSATGISRRQRLLKSEQTTEPVALTDQSQRHRALKQESTISGLTGALKQESTISGHTRALKQESTVPGHAESSSAGASKIERKVVIDMGLSKFKFLYDKDDFKHLVDKCEVFKTDLSAEDHVALYFLTKDEKSSAELEKEFLLLIGSVNTQTVLVPTYIEWENVGIIAAANEYASVFLYLDEKFRRVMIHSFPNLQFSKTVQWFHDMLHQYKLDSVNPGDGPRKMCGVPDRPSGKDVGKKISNFVVTCQPQGDRLLMNTRGKLVIHVSCGDMLRQPTEVIVNSANDQLAHGGGLARAIVMAGGPIIEQESRDIIKNSGPVKPGEVVHTSSGSLPHPICYVLHAVPPSQHQLTNGTEGEEKLVQVFYQCLKYTNETLRAKSISIPPMGAGIFNVPIGVIMNAAFIALGQFDQEIVAGKTPVCLKEVHFISNDPKLTTEMIQSFTKLSAS